MLPAAATDLRSLVEQYVYPIVVCDEDGAVRFCNVPAQTLFGGVDLVGRALPPEWMDRERVELELEGHPTTFRMLWAEIMWEGNPAWYLLTYPAEGGDSDDLRVRLEQSIEIAAIESEKRQQVESDREKLEAKLRDLHQRSVSKLEAARNALETEKAERQSLFERLNRLREETDQLKHQLDEKRFEVEEASHRSIEAFESLQAELVSKQSALSQAEEKSERYRRVYEELDVEMTRSQEQTALLSAKLRTAESRLDRAQRLLDGGSLEAIAGGGGADEGELRALRERVAELESELRRARLEATEPVQDDALLANLAALEGECAELRQRVAELEAAATSQIPTADSAEVHELTRRYDDARAVIAELRLHNDQELAEARGALAKLQSLYSAAKANPPVRESLEAPAADPTLQAALETAQQRIAELESTLENEDMASLIGATAGSEAADQALFEAQSRIAELEDQLASSQTGLTLDNSSWQERIAELETRLAQAGSGEDSPELTQLRERVAELEGQGGAPAEPDGAEKQRLEAELAQAHAQMNEMARELRRTMEGDRETKKLAYADQLTGLPNYNLTGQYLQGCFERSGRGEGALALILVDLDNFRRVNDALGTKSGDELLRQVGARLERTVVEKDTAIARRGEDEFMIVAFLEGATVDGEALSARVRGIAHNLLSELIKPFEVGDQRVQITASMGVALYPGPAADREALLEQAEHAMYKAKESGRARVSFYTQEIHQNRDRKIRVERELRQAVGEGQFTLLYQPIVEIPSGKVVGLEALVRWSHPQRGLLEPAEFLAVAEEIGVILPLSDQIMTEALTVAKQKFMKRRFMSLNLSHRQLVDASFPSRFMKQLERAQVMPNEVMVEVSEKTTRMDPERSRNTLAALAQWGVGIALDDFGSGSSELSMFREFPVRLVKIDGALIAKLPGDRETAKLCFAIARLAAAMEIPVLAEGVETREQLEMVSSFGCQYAQGVFLREPVNVNQLVQIL